MVHPSSAGVALGIGEVPVSVTGPYAVMPKEPDPAHMEVIWPTNQMSLNTSVLMENDVRWTVVRVPRRLANGAISVVLQPPGAPIPTTITVPREYLSTPIWWVGDVVPGPPQEEPGGGGEPPEDPQHSPDPVPV